MFWQPLTKVNNPHPMLFYAYLPAPYMKRWGQSISNIAKAITKECSPFYPAPSNAYNIISQCKIKYYTKKSAENIYPQQMGNVVEFLIACQTMGLKTASSLYFPQACDHIDDLYYDDPLNARKNGKKDTTKRKQWHQLDEERQEIIIADLQRLSDLLHRIENNPVAGSGTKPDGIVAACEFVAFHNTMHQGRKRYCRDGKSKNLPMANVKPTIECARSIFMYVYRALTLLEQYDKVQAYQFEYPMYLLMSHNNGVNGGRLDFVADNKIIDVKVDKSNITNNNKLQLLLYLAFMQRVKTKKPVYEAVIIDVRTGAVIEYDWRKLPDWQRRALTRIIDLRCWNDYEDKKKQKGVIEKAKMVLAMTSPTNANAPAAI